MPPAVLHVQKAQLGVEIRVVAVLLYRSQDAAGARWTPTCATTGRQLQRAQADIDPVWIVKPEHSAHVIIGDRTVVHLLLVQMRHPCFQLHPDPNRQRVLHTA